MEVWNYCTSNLDSEAILASLPRDEGGMPFFVYGEINVADSTRVYVANNTGISDKAESAAAAEHFFDFQGEASTNRWRGNLLENTSPEGPRVSVANSDTSDLLGFGE